jgi:Archaeal ATPase.
VRRVELELAPGLVVEFADQERALGQVAEWAERGTRWPLVIFGPEGCGKTAFLRQAASGLRELGYDVFYLHPLDRAFSAEVDDPDVEALFLDLVRRTLEDGRWGRLAMAVFDLTREILRRRKVAVIADDVFQAIGLDKAAYVKGLLNMIEHPQYKYENMVVLVATSEGVSRREIGGIGGPASCPCGIWRGTAFCSCMKKILGPKPPFEEAWRLAGGNPNTLVELYKAGWDVDEVAKRLIVSKGLSSFVRSLGREVRELLWRAVEDPDPLLSPEGVPLLERLIDINVLIDSITYRDPPLWIDQPPPERDLELGIGKHAA